MILEAYHDPGFEIPLGAHIMPIGKFAMVADGLRSFPQPVVVRRPASISEELLRKVHASSYVEAVRTGEPRALAESQKFPWSSGLYDAVRLTNGAVLDAARSALANGAAAAVASGFHHACRDHGEGFCTFNGLILALEGLRREGRIHRAAILDMDLHYGNGTAQLVEDRPWIFAISVYGNDYSENRAYRDVHDRRHEDGANHRSFALPARSARPELDAAMDSAFAEIQTRGPFDLLLFQAGADPLRDDPYSPLDLGPEDLLHRDARVFTFAKRHALPVAWTLAGGYTQDTAKVVEVHLNTFRAAIDVYS